MQQTASRYPKSTKNSSLFRHHLAKTENIKIPCALCLQSCLVGLAPKMPPYGGDALDSFQMLKGGVIISDSKDIRRYVMEKDPNTIEQAVRFAKMAKAFSVSTP